MAHSEVDLSVVAPVFNEAGNVAPLCARLKPVGADLPGHPSLIVSVMFFSGVQLMSLGMIGEYAGRIFAEVKRRPLYLVAERIAVGERDAAALAAPAHGPRLAGPAG